MSGNAVEPRAGTGPIKLFLCGDVMTGRGIDQVLPHPSRPRLAEPVVRSALDYVTLAERAHGPIARPVDFAYVWGAALEVLERERPNARIVNLETSVTASEDMAPKGINYRMNPSNVPCLTAAGLDVCGLANNHVLDWGAAGLEGTLAVLKEAGIQTAGAGADARAAARPAPVALGAGRRVLVFAMGAGSSGIPRAWAATPTRPGVNLLEHLSAESAARVAAEVQRVKRPGDLAVASIHWGGNWGYAVPPEQRAFARRLIDAAGIDLVHGHSSHHAKALEVHAGKLVLYGCGDFLNDYEGIAGREGYRGDLAVMYLPRLDPASGRLLDLRLEVLRIRNFRLRRAGAADVRWLAATLSREGARFGTALRPAGDGSLALEWTAARP